MECDAEPCSSGSLRLEGLDLIVPDQEDLRADRVALAALLPGTELAMISCTLTVPVRRTTASVFVVLPPPEPASPPPAEPAPRRAAAIVLQDSFLRSGGDAATIAAAGELTLDMTNVLVGTEGSLVHAFGSTRGQPLDPAAIAVRMGQVTARVKGGTRPSRKHARRTGALVREDRRRERDREHDCR